MNTALRYDKGLGNSEVYARLLSGTDFWNFVALGWTGTEIAACRKLMTEYPDNSTTQSWYSVDLTLPAGGPYSIEIVLASTGDVIGYDFVSWVSTDGQVVGSSSSTLNDLFDMVLQRLSQTKTVPQVNFIDAANLAVTMIYRRLMTRQSEMIQAEFVQPVTANPVTLPSDFEGFAEQPYLSGYSATMQPLPREIRSQLVTSSVPRYYELRGFTMKLFPAPSSSVTVVGQYYMRPITFSALTDAVPLNGFIDQIMVEAIVRISLAGLAVITDPTFQAIIYKMLDETLPFRAPRLVGYRQTIENGQRGRGFSPYRFD